MSATTTTAGPGGRRTTARVLGTMAVVGAAAAVAGLGTFGTFTDSTTPVGAPVQTGVVSIGLTAADGSDAVPLDFSGIVAGGSVTQLVDLVNDGDTALSDVALATRATASSLLDTDRVHGLQVTLQSCSEDWAGGFCRGEQREVVELGPVLRDLPLTDPFSLAPGATDHLAVTAVLPSSAGDQFKAQTSRLSLTFTATQRSGTAR
ncbi:hypothetical protein [Modestobacter sp. NPDC049651]|uniref:hypothetical protein n=1 Tax=unclassified Modestobacter TaxID=2643866 RepID=UPI0033FD71F4